VVRQDVDVPRAQRQVYKPSRGDRESSGHEIKFGIG
jgi:hypothetical protein